MLRFPGDVLAQFDCGTALPERDELEAIGTEGSLFLDDPWHCDDPVIELRAPSSARTGRRCRGRAIEVEPANPYRLELEAMNAAIRGETGAAARPRGRASARCASIEALFRSAASGDDGRSVMPDLKNSGYPGTVAFDKKSTNEER